MPVFLDAAYDIGYAIGQVIGVALIIGVPVGIGYLIYRLARRRPPDHGYPSLNGTRCTYCGAAKEQNARFCPDCGRQVVY